MFSWVVELKWLHGQNITGCSSIDDLVLDVVKNFIEMDLVEPTDEQLTALGCDSYEEYREPEETLEQKKGRITESLISSSDLSTVDFEWVTFTDKEIGEIIRSRVFAGNPYAESALQAKISAYILSSIAGNPNDELLASIQDKQEKINEIRLKFGLTII